MPDRGLNELRATLLESGVVPRHVARLVAELSEHYEDLEVAARQRGHSRASARKRAREQMGDTALIADQVLGDPEMRCWWYRFPKLARVALPVAYVLLLPTIPINAGVARAPVLGRWLACLLLSGVVTATMLLLLQITILFS